MTSLDGILNLNKDAGFTSHDVVARVRRILRTRKVGHTGTLDPMATGVLPICVGRATKASQYITDGDKCYLAGVQFGLSTDTQDSTGQVLERSEAPVSEAAFRAALPAFLGEIDQIPPMYSAIKQGGAKLYQLARKGISVERPPRRVTIHQIEVVEFCPTRRHATLRVTCSKGTYIRTLCHDLGQALACGAVMDSLCRERSGRFTLQRAVTLAQLEEAAQAGRAAELLLSLCEAFSDLPEIALDERQAVLVRNGVTLALSRLPFHPGDGVLCRVCREGELLLLARPDEQSDALKMETSFYGG